jgi:hypothetical protein
MRTMSSRPDSSMKAADKTTDWQGRQPMIDDEADGTRGDEVDGMSVDGAMEKGHLPRAFTNCGPPQT